MKKYLLAILLLVILLSSCTTTKAVVPVPLESSLETIPSDFVDVAKVIEDVILEVRYYSSYNFVGARIDGYHAPKVYLTKAAAEALKEVSDELKQEGYLLKLYDGYRPQTAVDHFVRWAEDVEDAAMKPYFYPETDKSVLFEEGFICEKSGHSRGSTIDLTLFDMSTGKDVDMGGVFDYFGPLSYPDYQDITPQQIANRNLLRDVMLKHGFVPFDTEWWHFTLENEPYPDTYFSFGIY